MKQKGRPVVQNNGHGSCLLIGPNTVSIVVAQVDLEQRGDVIVETIKQVEIHKEDPKEIIALNLTPGDLLKGEVRDYMSMCPPDPNDPELFLSWNPDGTVERIEGRPVYRWTEYVEDGVVY